MGGHLVTEWEVVITYLPIFYFSSTEKKKEEERSGVR